MNNVSGQEREISVRNVVLNILRNYEIQEDEYEEILELFEQEKIDECLLYVKKNKREQLK